MVGGLHYQRQEDDGGKVQAAARQVWLTVRRGGRRDEVITCPGRSRPADTGNIAHHRLLSLIASPNSCWKQSSTPHCTGFEE